MTIKTYKTDDEFFTLMNIPGPDTIDGVGLVYHWFNSIPDARYRYIFDQDIINQSFQLKDIDEWYPGISVISIVKNPWLRLVEGYYSSIENPESAIKLGVDISSFDKFVRSFANIDPLNFLQASWLTYKLPDGTLKKVSYILREEYLAEDFKNIQQYFNSDLELELPEYTPRDYRPYFNDELKKIVQQIFKDDIELLDYNF